MRWKAITVYAILTIIVGSTVPILSTTKVFVNLSDKAANGIKIFTLNKKSKGSNKGAF
jgi:hypothetical protein